MTFSAPTTASTHPNTARTAMPSAIPANTSHAPRSDRNAHMVLMAGV